MFVRMFGISLDYLVVEIEASAVLPLGLLDTDPDRQHLGALDAAVSGSDHSYDEPTPDIPACLGVGLTPLGGEAADQALQCGSRLQAKQAVNRDDEQGKMTLLLETGVKILTPFIPFRHDKDFLQHLMYVRRLVRIHHSHVEYAVSPPCPKVSDQQVTPLLRLYHRPRRVIGWVRLGQKGLPALHGATWVDEGAVAIWVGVRAFLSRLKTPSSSSF